MSHTTNNHFATFIKNKIKFHAMKEIGDGRHPNISHYYDMMKILYLPKVISLNK